MIPSSKKMTAKGNTFEVKRRTVMDHPESSTSPHSPEEVTSGPRILCWVIFFHYLSLASLNGLVL